MKIERKPTLKPCPFCGGRVTLRRGITGQFMAVCPCGSHIFFAAEFSEEKAEAAWNKRTSND